jgi:hypothetical protein
VLEMSLRSLTDGRLHIHAFWHNDNDFGKEFPFVGTTNAWAFEGSQPLLKPNRQRGRHSQKGIDRGHFYCQCKKKGNVYSCSNYCKYTDFIVEQKWVIGLWQRRKVSHEDARHEIIAARGHTMSYLREIETIQELEETVAIEQEKAMIDAQLKGVLKPFRVIPEVSTWMQQYERDSPKGIWCKESRFKFLVLTGPSCLGKTQFAKSLFGPERTFVVPCQNVKSPCLKGFKRSQHAAIVFDEADSDMIHDNKAVFQANNDIVLLAQSNCQEHVYSKFVYGTAMICCTNNWLENIERGSKAEGWLLANSVVYECTDVMWQQT